jgi:ABC-2 type transport system permease protein
VLSKTFLFFLLGPLFPLLLGGAFGSIGARVASKTERPVVAVVMHRSNAAQIAAARARLADALGDEAVVRLVYYAPQPDMAKLQRQLLRRGNPPIQAVVTGWLGDPKVAGNISPGDPTARQLSLILHDAVTPQFPSPSLDVSPAKTSSGSLAKERALTGQIAQMLIFFLTLFLAGMVMSQLIEEKSNKIIEVIAAAMPIDALFVGKLFAMLAASIIGILVWVSAAALFLQATIHGGIMTLPVPAVGWPGFLVLIVAYFTMNYLLIGAIMLTIGAQASTAREVQVLAMPATFGQLLLFALATAVVGSPNSATAIAASVFPLSSPMAMLGRAAQEPEWWPHLAALVWQALWVALMLKLAAQLFRKTVLKSGPRSRRWRWFRRADKAPAA